MTRRRWVIVRWGNGGVALPSWQPGVPVQHLWVKYTELAQRMREYQLEKKVMQKLCCVHRYRENHTSNARDKGGLPTSTGNSHIPCWVPQQGICDLSDIINIKRIKHNLVDFIEMVSILGQDPFSWVQDDDIFLFFCEKPHLKLSQIFFASTTVIKHSIAKACCCCCFQPAFLWNFSVLAILHVSTVQPLTFPSLPVTWSPHQLAHLLLIFP